MTIFGVIAIILGILCLLAPGLTGISVVFLLGVFVLAAGIVRMIWAFQAGSFGKGLLMFAIGGLTLLCGIALVANPLFGSGVLSVMLAVYFVFDGICEIVGGIRQRPESGWGWMLFGGIVSIWLGMMIWGQFPLSGVWAIGILLGIKLFFVGLIMVMGGSAVRSIAK
jgi:uncharacterized membrane protein HdeD (DUF308 family)